MLLPRQSNKTVGTRHGHGLKRKGDLMRLEIQAVINEIVWEGDQYGLIAQKWGTHRSFTIEMWESESLRKILSSLLEKETGCRPESWSFKQCYIIKELV